MTISPSGRKALAIMYLDERQGRTTYASDIHPATREALLSRGLIRRDGYRLDTLRLSLAGRAIAHADAIADALAAEGDAS